MMTGTSPAQFGNSPSFHSSSYLPKMEAAFMKDFTCCGQTLPSLHELLEHFEATHANAPPARASQSGQGGMPPTSGVSAAGMPTSHTQTHGDPALQTQHGFMPRQNSTGSFRGRFGSDGYGRSSLSMVQDMDTMGDLDMDDINGPMTGMEGLAPIEESPSPFSQQHASQFGQGQNGLTPLKVHMPNTMQNGMPTSNPNQPAVSQAFNMHNGNTNPTVSSVNTPTLGTMPMQNTHSLTSPESSHPGTPAELDPDFNNFSMMGGMMDMNMNFGAVNYGNGMVGFDGTIDQPGKRLFSKHGGGVTQQQLQAAYNNFQKMGSSDQSDLAKRLREQQIMAGANIPQLPFPEEVKPFRCPVIGCEKAYKNQNGLKYHKQVCCPPVLHPAFINTRHSTDTRISSSRRTMTAPSPLSIP